LTQYAVCTVNMIPTEGDCVGGLNTPFNAWNRLQAALKANDGLTTTLAPSSDLESRY
jgi:hypothetical protein